MLTKDAVRHEAAQVVDSIAADYRLLSGDLIPLGNIGLDRETAEDTVVAVLRYARREVTTEPPHGSVVLTQGPTGTAWQRHYSDGLWHSTTGKVGTWDVVVAAGRSPIFPILIAPVENEPATLRNDPVIHENRFSF